MEDGPEFAEGSYVFAGKTYHLAEVDSQMWRVYNGETYIGSSPRLTRPQQSRGLTTPRKVPVVKRLPCPPPTTGELRSIT